MDAPIDGATVLTQRQRKQLRKQALWNERSSWMTHWQDISRYQQPRAGRFLVTDRNLGTPRYNDIYDNTAIWASRTLAAGMMSGMTSPARPWFRLTLTDREMREVGAVKTWLHRTGILLREVFARSNTYRALHAGYEELGLFGTWSTVVLPDFDNVLHHYPMTVGEYALATDHRGVVNTVAREVQMTTGQMVSEFGRDNVSQTVRNLYDRHNLDSWVTVVHLVEPNRGRDIRKRDNKNMAFSSCYFEPCNDNSDKFLSESGFKRFPALAPRWVVTGQDIYGSSPGMEALGDVKQLQHQQLRKSQGIDYQTLPPLRVPAGYKDNATARLPGGIMYGDGSPDGGIRSAFEVQQNLQ
ncbi:MAG: portal protein, partial [Burkholderiaceae bacterium]